MPNGTYPIGPGAGPGAGIHGGGIKDVAGGLGGMLTRPDVKGLGAGVFITWLINKMLQTGHETGMRNIQREGLRSQAEMITPENLYFQAAQPQAQQEEAFAHQALMTQLAGGVLGPQLARGEYQIGG